MESKLTLAAVAAAAISALSVSAQAEGCTSNTRECMIEVANKYVEALVKTHDGSNLPLAPDVIRTEDGRVNARGPHEVAQSFEDTKMVKGARNVRYFVDEKAHQVILFCLDDIVLDRPPTGTTKAGDTVYKTAVTVPAGVYTSHKTERFKVDNGLISEVEIIAFVEHAENGVSGWPDQK